MTFGFGKSHEIDILFYKMVDYLDICMSLIFHLIDNKVLLFLLMDSK